MGFELGFKAILMVLKWPVCEDSGVSANIKADYSILKFMVKINETKYKNAILFFANKIRNGTLGKLKVMKLLYFLDFDFFEKYGKSVTGDEYLRFENGPVPRMAEKILKSMAGKEIKITTHKMPKGYNDQQHIEPLAEFNSAAFSKEEILMMDEIANKWEKFSGSEMKTASHGEAPWIATKPDGIIDYNLSYYRNKYDEMEKM
jgi:uncharacterized phage-associated protein